MIDSKFIMTTNHDNRIIDADASSTKHQVTSSYKSHRLLNGQSSTRREGGGRRRKFKIDEFGTIENVTPNSYQVIYKSCKLPIGPQRINYAQLDDQASESSMSDTLLSRRRGRRRRRINSNSSCTFESEHLHTQENFTRKILSKVPEQQKQKENKRHRKHLMITPKWDRKLINVNSSILLALFLLLLSPNCLVLLFKLPNIRATLASTTTNDQLASPANLILNHYHMDDGDSDQLPSSSGDVENFTPQIPFEYNNNNNRMTTPAGSQTPPTTTTQRPAVTAGSGGYARRTPPETRVTESELLPFTEFNIQQPTFSDLIKSWPPTTQQYLAASGSGSGDPAPRYAVGSKQNPRIAQNNHKDDYPDGSDPSLMRNHLNEDLDDTLVTADQGFERDQVAEPPTMINYLGDLGDYIYVQLRQYFDGSGRQKEVDGTTTSVEQPSNTALEQDNEQASGSASNRDRKYNQQQAKIETIDELLDDHYYDQYENSQVLYYGPQLVREGDIFEIGCYIPNDQKAEWTKSGKPLANNKATPRVIRHNDFLGAKQNYSLKVFEASLSDSGNYRCSRLSRKYHKLVVVPLKTTTTQLFLIQQRLLSVVNPKLVTVPQLQATGSPQQRGSGGGAAGAGNQIQRYNPTGGKPNRTTSSAGARAKRADYLLPGHLIVENQPLVVNCNITDEFVLRRLAENPKFQLAWYKNGKQLKGSLSPSGSHLAANSGVGVGSTSSSYNSAAASAYHQSSGLLNSNQSPQPGTIQVQVSPRQAQVGGQQLQANMAHHQQRGRQQQQLQQQQQQQPNYQTRPLASNQRIQFLQANGRQLYITSALYSDAGDYLCSWSKLPQPPQPSDLDENGTGSGDMSNSEETGGQQQQQQPTIASNPLAAGSLVQLMAPVKLRPFKSTYHVKAGNELRLVCQVQRGYPAAQVSWYVGNRLVDGDFLREHGDEFRVLQLQNQNQLIVTSAGSGGSGSGSNAGEQGGAGESGGSGAGNDGGSAGAAANQQANGRQIVEINPIPSGRQQMSLTANGRGQWIEYRDHRNEKYSIETAEQQLRYLKQKLAQLTGLSATTTTTSSSSSAAQGSPSSSSSSSSSSSQQSTSPSSAGSSGSSASLAGDPQAAALFSQTSISVLVINSLNIDRHTARYACRATTRINTDEATTVIRVQASSTVVIRPTSGRATLVPGQPLHFQCEMIGNKNAEFLWYKQGLGQDHEDLLEPNNDDTIEIHNERLTLVKPTYEMAGDYYCRALKVADKSKEFGVIKVRAQPYIEDFGHFDTSHTGKSSTIIDGERLELICTVRDKITPVNITWIRSTTPDDDRNMVPLMDTRIDSEMVSFQPRSEYNDESFIQTVIAQQESIIIETVDKHSKRLLIESVKPEHRSHYGCIVDNGVTEKTRKVIFIRVKDKLVALWPFLGIVAELFILFTIIHVWETQRAYKEMLITQQAENRLLQ